MATRCIASNASKAAPATHLQRRQRQHSVRCHAQTVSRCPFANLGPFSISPPKGKVKPAPLDSLEPQPYLAEAAFWLESGVSGQNTPGKLISGLHRLYQSGQFLLEDAAPLAAELLLKDQALASRRDAVLVAEPSSLAAQEELLELFLASLTAHYPDMYTVQGAGWGRLVTLQLPEGVTRQYRLEQYRACPLELCSLLVQEDLVLMREADEPGPDPQGRHHVMAGASVVFSFTELGTKLGAALPAIHAPVPGYEEFLERLLNRTFTSLQADKPLWRNNWGVAHNGDLDMPLYGSGGPGVVMQEALAAAVAPSRPPPHQLWLKVEYQTLRRLPVSRYILFTIKTMVQPMNGLGPAAAATLAASLGGMREDIRVYKGLGGGAAEELLAYLHQLAENGADGAAGAAEPRVIKAR